MTRLLLISGSTRADSRQTAALRTAVRSAPEEITAVLYDGLRTLPAFVPGELPPPEVRALRRHVQAAGAVLFSTPEYAGSLPGTLKNLLDHLVDGGDLDGKPVAWLSVEAPGQDERARTALEAVLGQANARILRPACIRIPLGTGDVDGGGTITDPRLQTALLDVLRALTRSPVAPQPRPQPPWQAYSSLYPMISPTDPPPWAGNQPGS